MRKAAILTAVLGITAATSLAVANTPHQAPPLQEGRETSAISVLPNPPVPGPIQLNPGAVASTTPSATVAALVNRSSRTTSVGKETATLSPTLPTSGTEISFGLYNPGVPDNMGQVSATENAVAKHAAILMWYKHWGGAWNNFYAQWVNAVAAHGSVPMITWMSDDYTIAGYPNPAVESAYSDQRIISGAYDGFIRGWADGLKATGRLVLLRFDHEMNGNWYAWSPGINGNTSGSYVAMWRHVYDIFVAEGASNVRWVWSPNVDYPGAPAFEAMYPGDSYVDWVALDGYNWGMTNGYTPWRSFTQVFGASYARLSRLTQKPVMFAEVGSVEAGAPAGQSKASWITSALTRELPANFPRVRAIVWFDQNNGGGQDFRIGSSPASLNAFRAAISKYSEGF